MRKKSKRSELQRNIKITKVTPKRKFKDECDECKTYKEDVHSYFDAEGIVYILCPECMKKNKAIVRNWKGEEVTHDEDESSKKTRTKKSASKNNTDPSNTEDGSKDSGQLLHSGVSRRKRNTEQSESRPRRRKTKSV